MAKDRMVCPVCGGGTDTTPSGLKKHEATSKHQLAASVASKVRKQTTKERLQTGFAQKPGETVREAKARETELERRTALTESPVLEEVPAQPVKRRFATELAAEGATEVELATEAVNRYKRYVRHGRKHELPLLPQYEASLKAAEKQLKAALKAEKAAS